ncbi:hypothetical protein DFH07DRAFT_774547 [Mycena maculata]|uniref:Uncharacterized protein n=1 Tax=Mycena maculata TaxID=230809 RepID=A0AAD7IYY3_9AGAR|nr:hypothetical protein DFH07DRAFT_774547 [Mycena maculata]
MYMSTQPSELWAALREQAQAWKKATNFTCIWGCGEGQGLLIRRLSPARDGLIIGSRWRSLQDAGERCPAASFSLSEEDYPNLLRIESLGVNSHCMRSSFTRRTHPNVQLRCLPTVNSSILKVSPGVSIPRHVAQSFPRFINCAVVDLIYHNNLEPYFWSPGFISFLGDPCPLCSFYSTGSDSHHPKVVGAVLIGIFLVPSMSLFGTQAPADLSLPGEIAVCIRT